METPDKFIIENRSNLETKVAIELVLKVIKKGRISRNGTQYCYATKFLMTDNSEYMVYTDLNKKSDRFVITPINRDGGE